MLFNSLTYIVFFLTVLVLFYLLPHRFRWGLLLAASYVFYAAWDARLLLLIVLITFVNYALSRLLARFGRRRRLLLWAAVGINLGTLAVFKYAGFLGGLAGGLLAFLGFDRPDWAWRIILPLGISFYTFQAMGYTVDVYRGLQPPERNFFKFSLFITFFPQMVAGPIERARELMPQLFTVKTMSRENFHIGARYLLLGFYKKAVIADRAAAAVNTVYNNPAYHAGLPSVIATFLFAFQIYCDFSGYSDIAKGCAKMLGVDLTLNFRQPYFSAGIQEFWRRWHVSLSGWFKDYVYFPLGGSRVGRLRHYGNLLMTFLVSGLWHGADMTFVLWGALHGLYQVAGDALGRAAGKTRRPLRALRVVFTFLLVCFAWIFFRANSVADALYIAGHLFADAGAYSPQYVFDTLNQMGMPLFELAVVFAAIGFLLVMEACAGRASVPEVMAKTPAPVRWAWYLLLTLAIAATGVFGHASAFIYFQF